jgi:hypothetical protein
MPDRTHPAVVASWLPMRLRLVIRVIQGHAPLVRTDVVRNPIVACAWPIYPSPSSGPLPHDPVAIKGPENLAHHVRRRRLYLSAESYPGRGVRLVRTLRATTNLRRLQRRPRQPLQSRHLYLRRSARRVAKPSNSADALAVAALCRCTRCGSSCPGTGLCPTLGRDFATTGFGRATKLPFRRPSPARHLHLHTPFEALATLALRSTSQWSQIRIGSTRPVDDEMRGSGT